MIMKISEGFSHQLLTVGIPDDMQPKMFARCMLKQWTDHRQKVRFQSFIRREMFRGEDDVDNRRWLKFEQANKQAERDEIHRSI